MDNPKYSHDIRRKVGSVTFLLTITNVWYVFSQIQTMNVTMKTNVMEVVWIQMAEFYTHIEKCVRTKYILHCGITLYCTYTLTVQATL
jgi:hypothetical protein